MQSHSIVILDNIRSAHNVGSIFRTCDGAGVSELILYGYTPAPIDRFGRVHGAIEKTSLGATTMLPWEAITELEDMHKKLGDLNAQGYTLVSVEQTEKSISLYEFLIPQKVAYIFGNEIDGVSQELLDASDTCIEIPMAGKKESLNVGVSVGIILFHR
jgi:23S rRNA (guanosine2251-2'-O)-methyltransferase